MTDPADAAGHVISAEHWENHYADAADAVARRNSQSPTSACLVLFISAWNQYQWPLIVLQQEMGVIQVGVRSFLGAGEQLRSHHGGKRLAGLRVVALHVVLQRRIVAGFVRSGLKKGRPSAGSEALRAPRHQGQCERARPDSPARHGQDLS